MLEPLRKKQLINIILNLKDREEHSFKGLNDEEKEFLLEKISKQDGSKGFIIETNGTSEKSETILKFRKLKTW